MRRKNCYLAAIMAAVLVLQTPTMAFAAEPDGESGTAVTTTDSTTETDGESSTGTTSGSSTETVGESSTEITIIKGTQTSETTYSKKIEDSTENISGDDIKGGTTYGLYAENSTVNVEGSINADSVRDSIYAKNSTVNVSGDIVNGVGEGLEARNSTVNITGDIIADEGLGAYNNSTVKVEGNVEGSVSSGSGSTVEVKGDVTEEKIYGINAGGKSTIIVDGNVTGGGYTQTCAGMDYSGAYPAISAYNSANVLIGGDATAGEERNVGAPGVNIKFSGYEKQEAGTIAVLGELTSTADQPAIYISTFYEPGTPLAEANELVSSDELFDMIPDIVVGSINSPDDKLVEIFNPTNPDNQYDNDLKEKVIAEKIFYIINHDSEVSVDGAETRTLADGADYQVSNENKHLTISVGNGYSVYADGIELVNNGDGTYTLIVPRGGGIDIKALRKAIDEMSDDITIAVSEEEKSFEEFQEQVQNEIAEIPDGGTYEIVSDSLVTFNRKTIEAFAKRSDVSISIIYTLNGKKYKVVIPAGYNMMDLLDENGYCGCLYLNMLFGSELAE